MGRIAKYLSNRESDAERRELFDAYDRIQEPEHRTEAEYTHIAQGARQRILQTIGANSGRRRMTGRFWVSSAAAILVVLGGLYWFMSPSDRVASQEELVSLLPGQNHAIIILPSGERVNLDSIALSQSIQVGNTIITKSENGEISYESVLDEENPIYTLQTPKSVVSEIILSDGTKVMLNAESKLYYPAKFDEGDRVVSLEGEGYFVVRKTDERSRFVVKSAEQEVTVLGTKFNVKAYQEDEMTYTTLEEGSVSVAAGNRFDDKVVLSPGRQAIENRGELQVQAVDLESVLGWTKGVFYFDGTNTLEILQQIEQWYDIDITYKENKETVQYSGKIPRNLSLDKLIDLLKYADFKVVPRIDQKNRINLIIN